MNHFSFNKGNPERTEAVLPTNGSTSSSVVERYVIVSVAICTSLATASSHTQPQSNHPQPQKEVVLPRKGVLVPHQGFVCFAMIRIDPCSLMMMMMMIMTMMTMMMMMMMMIKKKKKNSPNVRRDPNPHLQVPLPRHYVSGLWSHQPYVRCNTAYCARPSVSAMQCYRLLF